MEKRAARRGVVHVVDDDVSVRTSLCRLLQAAGYTPRPYPSAGAFLLAAPDPDPGPSCVLLDLKMPGPSGLDLQQGLARRGDPLPVVFLTGHADIPSTVRALRAGASDFLEKPVKREALLAAIEAALAQDAERCAQREELRALHARYESLTAREREVFELVVAGKLNKQIAGDIGAAERTVKAHRAQVMEKMQVGSLADLVRVAERLHQRAGQAPPKDD
jgi:FixJ family two-component response regulator